MVTTNSPTYFSSSALMRAKTTPMPAEAKNIKQKRLRAMMMASPRPTLSRSSPEVLGGITVVVNTIEMASFKMLSPKTNMLRTGSMSSAWNMAMVATGSTAVTSKVRQQVGHTKSSLLTRNQRAEGEAFDEIQLVSNIGDAQQVNSAPNNQRADGCAENGKHADRSDVLEKVSFVQVVA